MRKIYDKLLEWKQTKNKECLLVNGATISLNNYINTYKPIYAYKLTSGNIGISDTKISLPIYMSIFI